jgi:AmmeMemoRadiSam system protein A
MGPMPSTEPVESTLGPDVRRTLLAVAAQSIRYGLRTGAPLPVRPEDFDPPLRERRASFVTLHHQSELRGCIGHLQAVSPLVVDVAGNAFAAAFRDPRFPPLAERELTDLQIHISVLTTPEPMSFDSERDLLAKIRPGVDGLILRDGVHQGTFLPSVWESLPDPTSFLAHLKNKAGLPTDYWSDTLTVSRYRTESFS